MAKVKQIFGLLVLIYLRILSKIQLIKIRPIIVGITGSTGKTSLMSAVKEVLSVKYKVKVSEKANSESGIPLDILGLHMINYSVFDWMRVCVLAPLMVLLNWDPYDVYIVEMGVDSPKSPKNMDYLLKIVQPNVGVILNVAAVHSEQYDHLVSKSIKGKERSEKIIEHIAHEKGKLLGSVDEKGYAIGNFDDDNVKRILSECSANTISFGKQNGSDFKITSIHQDKDVYRVDLLNDGIKYTVSLHDKTLPDAYAYIFAAAMCVANSLDVDLEKSAIALKKYQLPAGRMSVFEGIKGTTIVDSSYNSSRLSVEQALNLTETLSQEKKRRIILALGDMREMGEESRIEHEQIAISSVKIANEIVLVGPMMKEYFSPKALELGFDENKMHFFERSSVAGDYIKDKLIEDGDVILVKGSQNTLFMENIVEKLLADPNKKRLLCRRGKYWDKIRKRY